MKKLLLCVLLLAACLRFYKLDSYPVSLSWDEAAIGYNAFSIAKTGQDEYGEKFPLLFQSFNDWKLPGYIYVDAVFVKTFGLSEFWVRFPSALFGTIAVLLTFLLFRKILDEKVGLAAAFLMAISPWHLQFSRAAFESNAALTIILLGLTLLFYGFQRKSFAVLSVPVLTLSLYFYYSPRIFVPLILLFVLILYKKEISKNYKYYLLGAAIAVLVAVPIVTKIISPQGLKRVQEVSLFSDVSIIQPYVAAKSINSNPLSMIFLNRRIPLAFESLHSYFAHLSPGFLFFGDDPNPRHRTIYHGNLYLIEIPLLAWGLWILLKQKENKPKWLLIAWLLLAPIPAAFAREFPHGLRALLMVPAVVTLSGIGLVAALRLRFAKLVIALVFTLSIVNYLFNYYVIYPQTNSRAWAYGYKQAIQQSQSLENSHDKIIFSGNYWKPYIFYLFYSAIDPHFYIREGTQEKVGKYQFGQAAWDGGKNLDAQTLDELKMGKTLVIISQEEWASLQSKEKFTNLKTIYDYSGTGEVFKIGQWE
ncbi:MAG: glycosyltransferase family 39 protein [Candidatus Curtissbacteria bacterium]